MADSAEEVRTQEEASATQVEGDEDFNAGFSDTPTEVTPPVTEEPKLEDKPGDEPAATKELAAPETNDEVVQVTKSQFEQLMGLSTQIEQIRADAQKKIDTAFGKVGGIERRLQELQSATPAGYAVEVTDDIVADLKAEFPELGDLQLGVLKKFASKLKGTSTAPFDPNQVVPIIEERTKQLQRDILSMKHEDWEEVVGVPDANGVTPKTDYRKWLGTQSEEYRQQVGGSWDARVIAKSIDKFKAEAKVAAEKAAAEAAKKTPKPATSARQRALESAVTPRGEGGRPAGPTEEDEFEAGFNG
jgi:hypothetical protein